MKTIKIEKCDKLKAIIATREKREDMINSSALLESLHLRNLPNLGINNNSWWHLLLKELPNLKAFFQGHYNLDFPSLKIKKILEVFSRCDSDTPRLEDFTIKIESLSSNV
ncbi:hypothetical protein MTR_7g088110 [Medicago truncatula]|uniref:Uncharacterized protein n=1 Tax=Medicago truncatula TaxID=3880 RepID=G7L3R8_MEDTR|nr:hypothetical protein MTR_7g088110 [Medicago truncatula]